MLFSELPYLCRRIFATVSVSLYLCHRIFAAVSLSPYLCYPIFAAVSSPCCFPRPAVFSIAPRPHIPARLSCSPTFGRWAVSPHFLLTFRRCAEAALPLELPVAAFPHPSYHSHLPKVSSFPTFSTHLPKVRRSRTASKTTCSLISPSTVPFPPSEGAQFPHIFYSPSEGVQKHYRLESRL